MSELPEIVPNTCLDCSGSGYSNQGICTSCYGGGSLPVVGHLVLFKQLMANLDVIIAEQASQREDLTAALTRIWNKVKGL